MNNTRKNRASAVSTRASRRTPKADGRDDDAEDDEEDEDDENKEEEDNDEDADEDNGEDDEEEDGGEGRFVSSINRAASRSTSCLPSLIHCSGCVGAEEAEAVDDKDEDESEEEDEDEEAEEGGRMAEDKDRPFAGREARSIKSLSAINETYTVTQQESQTGIITS